jgi:hypothetical protein
VERNYNIFEICPDHSLKWHACVQGTHRVLEKLEGLRQKTLNECFAARIGTQEIVCRVNLSCPALDDRITAN